jgi:hypothetical protein
MNDNQWCQHDIMGAIIMELHSSWKWVILIELQLSCNELQLSCNELHYIYGELKFYNSKIEL